MIDFDINNLDKTAIQHAEQLLIAAIREVAPDIDLRNGTAIRDTLIRTDAIITALNRGLADSIRKVTSVNAIKDNENATVDDLAAVLSNYNITPMSGAVASGVITITTASDSVVVLNQGAEFIISELKYTTTVTTVARKAPREGEVKLQDNNNGTFSFNVNIVAEDVGAKYNMPMGTVLEFSKPFYGFLTAATATPVTGGKDPETVDAALLRIPAALTYRSANSAVSLEGLLRANLPEVNIQAISAVGMGDAMMYRDRRNIFGISTGGCIDAYIRTYAAPIVAKITKTAIRQANGDYTCNLSNDDIKDAFAIRAISDSDVVLSTHNFTTKVTGSSSYHGIDGKYPQDIAFSMYHKHNITISNTGYNDAERDFYITVWLAPGISAIQEYLDTPEVKQLNADVIVRAPLMCSVSCSFRGVIKRNTSADIDSIKQALVDYINTRSFTGILTRTELTTVMINLGIANIRLTPETGIIYGTITGADGKLYQQSGDVIDIATMTSPDTLIDKATVVFASTKEDININLTQE